jgi:hypothetical protein
MISENTLPATSEHPIVQMPVAVLCAARNSIYKRLEGVEVYDIERDVRTFDGGKPVVAHPPCRAWSAYCAHQAKPAEGEKDLGPLCVDWVKQCGGILEHPAHSRLWDHCGLPKPGSKASNTELWSMEVNQSWWGDTRIKKTWLLIAGVSARDFPEVPFRLHESRGDRRRWQVMSKHQRAATVPAFAEWLVNAARKAEI